MTKVFPSHSFLTEPLHSRQSCHRPGSRLANEKMGAHGDWLVDLPWYIEAENFNGNFPTLECALKYLRWVCVFCNFQRIDNVLFEFHRIGDQLVVATKLA